VRPAGAATPPAHRLTGCRRDGNIEAVKLNSKNRSTLLILVALSMIIGTVAWEIVERILSMAGATIDLTVGPLELDAYVISIALRPNPGTLLGIVPGVALFRRA
jgi:hypothetical protein